MAGDPEPGGSEDEETPAEAVAIGAVTFLTLGVAFGLMALGVSYFWVAFPVGFGGGIPLAAGLAKWYESREEAGDRRTAGGDTDAALADLRERYARGELDEAEFEARVERLLETESVADARKFAERERRGADGRGDESGRGSEPERVGDRSGRTDERERA